MREPYADRFRLIFNDLGAGFAARGEDLDAIIRRADPALRQTNLVLAELARQNQALERLARDGDTVLQPWARERRATAQFINNAQVAAEATAERSADLEAGFQRFPEALRQLRLTMAQLRAFSDQATPVFAEFRDGGPAIARATRALGPFADATEPSLTSLGTAAEQSRQPLLDAVPTLRDAVDLTESAAPGARRLSNLFGSLRRTGFHENFMSLLFNTTGAINGYDSYGHMLRAWLVPNNACTQLNPIPNLACPAQFGDGPPPAKSSAASPARAQAGAGVGAACQVGSGGLPEGLRPGPSPSCGAAARPPSLGAVRSLLDTMIGKRRQGPGGSQ